MELNGGEREPVDGGDSKQVVHDVSMWAANTDDRWVQVGREEGRERGRGGGGYGGESIGSWHLDNAHLAALGSAAIMF